MSASRFNNTAFERRKLAANPIRASVADHERVIDCLTAAFASDPVMLWIERDGKRDRGRRALFSLLVRTQGLLGGELWTTENYSAAAVWVPFEETGLRMPWWRGLRYLPASISLAWFINVERVILCREAAGKHHPRGRPHFYLMAIGVDPQFQRQGLGSTLLDANLAAIDAKGLPTYLESSNEKNVPLYRRYGYQVINDFRPAPDGPTLWGMWREAKGR